MLFKTPDNFRITVRFHPGDDLSGLKDARSGNHKNLFPGPGPDNGLRGYGQHLVASVGMDSYVGKHTRFQPAVPVVKDKPDLDGTGLSLFIGINIVDGS